ncbi:hypothetical protein Tco_0701637 [Tanacetum coccineum]
MKAYPKHIDWGKVIATNEIMDGYVMPKYGNKNLFEDDSWIDIIMDDVYHTFYKDEEEAKVAKASEDMKLSIMKEKFLAMVESEKARVKDYTKLVVTDGMVDYVLEKYGNKWKSEDEIAYVILEDLWLKYGKDDKGKGKLVEDNEKGKEAEHHHLKVNKDDKGKGKLVEDNGKGKVHDIQNRVGYVEVDLARAIKAKQVDDHDDDALDTLDLENRIKKLEEDFGRLLKAKKAKESKKAKEAKKAREAELAKQAKKTKEDELKAKEAKKEKKAKEAELKAKEAKKAKEAELKAKKAKEAMLAELKAKKAKKAKNSKEAMLAEVVQISSDEDDDEDPTAPTSTRSKAPTASTSTRSRAPIASTSNAQAAFTAPRGCVIALFAPNAPPPSATRKRKPT